jgi:hypothetical protein
MKKYGVERRGIRGGQTGKQTSGPEGRRVTLVSMSDEAFMASFCPHRDRA